nr:cyclin-D-binding Myb-like transcription factor 1 isoform X2 [Procambarus clarkii]
MGWGGAGRGRTSWTRGGRDPTHPGSWTSMMEVIESVCSVEDNGSDTTEDITSREDSGSANKRIRLLVTSDVGASNKLIKDVSASDGMTNVFLYSNDVPAEIVMESVSENIIAMPLGTSVVKNGKAAIASANVSSPLRILKIPHPIPRKQKSVPVITVRQARGRPSHADSNVNKLFTSVLHTKPRQNACTSVSKSVSSDVQTKLETKSDSIGTMILSTSGVQTKSKQTSSSPQRTMLSTEMKVKSHLGNFQDEHLQLLTDSTDKPSQSGSNVHTSQTVMMRVNSVGELELDPMFLNTETLSESETDEMRLPVSTELTAQDHLTNSSLSNVTRSENVSAEEDDDDEDMESPTESQMEAGSSSVNQSWFTSREDKEMLRWRGHAWRQGMWSKEETELLQHNIEQYCAQKGLSDPGSVIFKMSKEERSGFYRVVARGLNRPLFSVYRRIIRIYDNHNHIGKYTSEEVNKLRELRTKHGKNWQAIAAHLGRSAASVKDRCRLLNENCNRGAWSADEEDRLSIAVYDMAQVLPGEQVTSGISWGEVSNRVRTRSEKQCRTKWLNYLNWKRASGVEWSKADDIQLICRLSVCGVGEESQVDWSALARIWPACRSPHWLRGKWWNLKRRLPQSSQDTNLKEMCQQLYNMQSLSLLQSTLVELPATFLNTLTNSPLMSTATSGNKSSMGVDQDCVSVGTIKLCIPAANFSTMISSVENEEQFGSRLSELMQSALLAQSVDVRVCQPTSVVSQPHCFTSPTLTTQVTTQLPHLSSTLANDAKPHSIVVETMQDSLSMDLPDVHRTSTSRTTLLDQDLVTMKEEDILSDGDISHSQTGLATSLDPSFPVVTSQVILNGLVRVKEEDILSDGDISHSQTGLATSLDPSSPVVTSQVILNDPILSVSGEPLGHEEGLQPDHDDSEITCRGLSQD